MAPRRIIMETPLKIKGLAARPTGEGRLWFGGVEWVPRCEFGVGVGVGVGGTTHERAAHANSKAGRQQRRRQRRAREEEAPRLGGVVGQRRAFSSSFAM